MAPLLQLPCGQDDRNDASPSALAKLKYDYPDIVNTASTPDLLYPELTRPLVDAWSMTSLRQHEGRPEVTPWLRGWEKNKESQSIVAWRKYLPNVQDTQGTSVLPSMEINNLSICTDTCN